ncbi:MAG: PEP/pyruvate-binding domain-containing protein, partial [Bacteroidota bacterium]
LIRRFLTDQLQFIDIAKSYSRLQDFYDLLQNMIFPPESHGKLGGKSAGLFLARKIIKVKNQYEDILKDVKIPKTWYITSDGLMSFMYYNNLEDIIEQKYKDIEDIRKEYPHIIQAFKNSNFPAEIVNGLSRALDDFGDNPIIVRSSSLLEDRMGSAFAGKYKSLFLGNQGSKKHKLETLMDAIAEVYASTFGPDPIGYRFEKGLLDFNEEMGIMIQEVVGKKVGKYFLPAYAGVAFSMNEFRWSPRIDREDGLIRMVPGLGTRAVDRIGDDYPMLIAPGKPDLRVNLSYQEMVGYSPKSLDVINLETNTFETTSIENVIKEAGNQFPMLNEVFSILEEKHIKKPVGLGIDTKKHDIVVTFENLISTTDHIQKINAMLKILTEKLKTPVDIEFACDGKNLYLLQCRPQSETSDRVSAIIPQDISQKDTIHSK